MRVKKILAPKDISIAHSIFDSFGNELFELKALKTSLGMNLNADLDKEKLRNP